MKLRKNKIIMWFSVTIGALALTSTYNACSKQNTSRILSSQSVATSTDTGGGGVAPTDNSTVGKPSVSLLTYEQMLQSSLSLTGVALDNNIRNEFNTRTAQLSESFDVGLTNSPMWVGLTNINGQVCNALVAKESALAAAQRKFFGVVDFTKAVSSVTDQNFNMVMMRFSNIFWGRDLSVEEQDLAKAVKAEFIAAIAANAVTNAQQTKNLMFFGCVAMLSSFESFSL